MFVLCLLDVFVLVIVVLCVCCCVCLSNVQCSGCCVSCVVCDLMHVIYWWCYLD